MNKYTLRVVITSRYAPEQTPHPTDNGIFAVLCTRGFVDLGTGQVFSDAGVLVPTFTFITAGTDWHSYIKSALTHMIVDDTDKDSEVVHAKSADILYYASDTWVHGLDTQATRERIIYFVAHVPHTDLGHLRFPSHAGNPKRFTATMLQGLGTYSVAKPPSEPTFADMSKRICDYDRQAVKDALEWSTRRFGKATSEPAALTCIPSQLGTKIQMAA